MAIPYNGLNNFKNVAKDMDINVLWVDTEQSERHVRRVIDRIVEILNTEYGGCDVYIYRHCEELHSTTLLIRN